MGEVRGKKQIESKKGKEEVGFHEKTPRMAAPVRELAGRQNGVGKSQLESHSWDVVMWFSDFIDRKKKALIPSFSVATPILQPQERRTAESWQRQTAVAFV